MELISKGFNQTEITKKLQINKSTISKDVAYLNELSQEQMRNHVKEKLPMEFNTAITGINEILRSAWTISTR